MTLSESKKELLGKLLRGRTPTEAKLRSIPRRPEGGDTPMSYGQQQVWLHSQFSPKLPIYNEPVTIHHYGSLDRGAIGRAFTEIVNRHEAWRTTFGWKNGELVQRIHPRIESIEIPFLDVSMLSAEGREEAAIKIATEDALAPFDLATGPMYRPRLVQFSPDESRLYLSLHHIIFDGVSLYRVFLPELQELYNAFSNGQPSPLAPLALQYGDYAIWHRRWVEEVSPAQLAYWKARLEGVVRRDILSPDHARSGAAGYKGAMETLALSAEVSAALKSISQREGVTLFISLLATFQALIWAYTREDDLVIGSTSAGRSRSETDDLLGFFLNTIVLRTDLGGDPTFLDLLQRAKEEVLNALANDGIPFEHLVKELCSDRDGNKTPFFQVLFSFEPPLAPLGPGWKFTQMDIETGAAKFDLHLELDERADGIIGRFIYNADLFDQATIEEMLERWRDIVHEAVADPSRRLAAIVPRKEELRRWKAADADAAAIAALQETKPPAAVEPGEVSAGGLMRSFRRLWKR